MKKMPIMRRLNLSKNSDAQSKGSNLENVIVPNWECGLNWLTLMGISVACLMGLSSLFSVTVILQDIQSNSLWAWSESTVNVIPVDHRQDPSSESPQSVEFDKDNLPGGLLATGFEKKSCLSRFKSSLYRKDSPYKPTSYFLSKLRAYEALHKRCGPKTESYNRTVELIISSQQEDIGCNYLVWISSSDLSNRILSIASAFLYAMITDRVLLIDRETDIDDLFCEPFPDSSWLLPLNFPLINQFHNFNQKSPLSYGNMLRNYIITDSTLSYPPYLYLHLVNDYDDHDKLFFCDQDQNFLQKVPWLIMKTDNYFIPSLFLIPSFEQQLHELFPQKDTVFHFLGRYLFHPTNSVWGLITRYYDTYLANADERVGIQIRVYDTGTGPFQHVLDQIVACTIKEGILPQHNEQGEVANLDAKQRLKAVLVTSESSGYSDSLKNMYWEKPTVSGEVVSVYLASHDEDQQMEKRAWAEMYLLSLTDALVTSSRSTFGYVAQGLGGLKSWVLYKPENQTAPNPPCHRAMSMEPCFHAPPSYDCKAKKKGVDVGLLVPHVRHCEMSWGLKLVDT